MIWRVERSLSSREVMEELGGNEVISRASVKNFLEDSIPIGLLEMDSITSRGVSLDIQGSI